MSRRALVLLVAAWPAVATADKQTDELKVGYQKEAAGCTRSRDGLAKVVEGATELAKSIPESDKPALDGDVDKLTKGLAVVTGYCDELAGVIEVLNADPNPKYKKLEKDLDERDNRIRKARAASKKVLAETSTIASKLIPRINAARVSGPAPTPEKRTPAKFPSGRTIELPSLPGTWKVSGSTATDTAEYAEKTITAIVATRSFAKATCDQQRRVATTDADQNIVDVAVADDAKRFTWFIAFTRKGHAMQIGCAALKTGGIDDGGIVASLDASTTDTKLVDPLAKLLLRMTAARLPTK